jgi:hypothetical protein
MIEREADVPDSFGKRNRDRVKASKAAARDERRVARARREKDRQTGSVEEAEEPTDGAEQEEGAVSETRVPAPEELG